MHNRKFCYNFAAEFEMTNATFCDVSYYKIALKTVPIALFGCREIVKSTYLDDRVVEVVFRLVGSEKCTVVRIHLQVLDLLTLTQYGKGEQNYTLAAD